ncbi:MAG: hypothetical protein IJV82_00755 [Oscillospiraceae bacterium]|nr:hypothetical protein [Oscillospiraceae bacterium]
MKTYRKFRYSCLDISPLGLITGPEESGSVYTPAGARIVAWALDSEVHFCQVEGFGGMVFAVDPSATPGDCVRPVAKSLEDFIGLLVVSKDAALILGAHTWSRSLFQQRMDSIVINDHKTRSVMRAIENTYHPPKIADPYGYIVDIQQSFDYASLPLRPDYFEWCPIRPGMVKWDVGYGTGFAEYCEKSRIGNEITVGRAFQWHGENWFVPSIYLCDNGIVVDSILEVTGEEMARFNLVWGSQKPEDLSAEDLMRRKLDDPLGIEVISRLAVNSSDLPRRKSHVLRWDPAVENSWNARRTLEHYGLDRNKGYLLRRDHFLRKGKNPPIQTMVMNLEAIPAAVPGIRFVAPKPGESMVFSHPVTDQTHTLTVKACTREALDPNFLSNHPCCYTRLTYSIEPAIDKDMIRIVDCDPGDPFQSTPEAPAAVILTDKVPSAGHFAISSLRHTPADSITWRMIFRQKLRSDVTVPVLP